jgi:hypothetical protein
MGIGQLLFFEANPVDSSHLLRFFPLGTPVTNWMLTVEFCFVRTVVRRQEGVSCKATSAHFTNMNV